AALEAVHILTMLGRFANGQLDDIVLRSLRATPLALLNAPLVLPRVLFGGLAPESAIAQLAPLLTHKLPTPSRRALPFLLSGLATDPLAGAQRMVVDESISATEGNGAVSVSVRTRAIFPLAWLNDPRKLLRAILRTRSPSN